MSWTYLFVAGLCEVGWAIGLKYTEGFSKLLPSILTVMSMIASMGLLSMALRNLPIGTAYAIWTGIGIVGTFGLGIMLFDEPLTVSRCIFAAMIACGIVGLRFTS